jgi:hypothetical protein
MIFPQFTDVSEPMMWARGQFGDPIPFRHYEGPIRAALGRWTIHNGRMFSFRDEADAFAFKLRWG